MSVQMVDCNGTCGGKTEVNPGCLCVPCRATVDAAERKRLADLAAKLGIEADEVTHPALAAAAKHLDCDWREVTAKQIEDAVKAEPAKAEAITAAVAQVSRPAASGSAGT